MNSVEKEAVLHCLKSMIDVEACEECPLYGTTGTDHCEKDCVRLAINALEQEPCEDAVSRQAVLEVIRKCHYEEWVKADIGAPIEALPSVSPQPKTGRWIYTGDYITDGMLKCSECGFEHDVSERFSYCPMCGAKMQEIPTGAVEVNE